MTARTSSSDMTLYELYNESAERLSRAGVDSPAFESKCLFEEIFSVRHSNLSAFDGKELTPDECESFRKLITRRIQGEPLQYILGYWEFYGRKFYVGEGVLIPRDDTEVVLRSTLSFLKEISTHHAPRILDLCSGSGILAITLKCEFENSEVTAVEISDAAIAYLTRNAELNNADINIVKGDIFAYHDLLPDRYFDLIISNPPYIRTEELSDLQREVRCEPVLALDGGNDGLDFYRHIVPSYTPKLTPGGMLALELDGDEADKVHSLMLQNGYENVTVFEDIGGIHRAINGTLFDK